MNFIRPREISVYVMAACTVIACAQGTTSTGGGGAGGEDTWGSPASGSSSSSSSSGSGGPTTCDMNSVDCPECIACSRGTADGLCGKQYNDCLANMECVNFASCISECADGDTACTSTCEGLHPTGIPIFDVYASCVICQDCYGMCDGASACQ